MRTKDARVANADRQARFAERMESASYFAVRGIWAHIEDHHRIKQYAARLAKARGDDPRKTK